jgi:ubiquinone biosynthesis protein UbiJ
MATPPDAAPPPSSGSPLSGLAPDAWGAHAFNRALANAPWARERLLAHAGQRFAVVVGPMVSAFRIGVDGTLEPAGLAGTPPDVELRLSPLALPAFLAEPARWNELVDERGDPALGGTLKELAQTLPWFVEETFARTFGAVVGQRLADAGRALLKAPVYAAERLAESATSYARDEAGLLARGDEMRPFVEQSARLAARVDAAQARLERLAQALGKQ